MLSLKRPVSRSNHKWQARERHQLFNWPLNLIAFGVRMTNTLDQDVHALKEWLRVAWRYLADPCLTSFERRELRNYMKDAGYALSSGLKQAAARDRARCQSDGATLDRCFNFRIFKVDA